MVYASELFGSTLICVVNDKFVRDHMYSE